MSAVLSSARPNRSPRSFRAWLAFCTALVTLSAAEWSILLPAKKGSSKAVKQGDQQEAGSEAKQSAEKRKEGEEETFVTLVKRQKPVTLHAVQSAPLTNSVNDARQNNHKTKWSPAGAKWAGG